MTDEGEPSYDLLEVQFLVRLGRVAVTLEVQRTMTRDELHDGDLISVLLELTRRDFRKSMPSERDGVTMLDVYRPVRNGRRLYLKYRLTLGERRVFVLSFKKDSSR